MAVNIDRTTFPAEGGVFNLSITKEDHRPWTVAVSGAFVTVNRSEAFSDFLYKLELDIAENNLGADRAFTILAGSDMESEGFLCVQYSAAAPLAAEIIAATTGNIAAAGGQVTVDIYADNGDDALSSAVVSSGNGYCHLISTTHGVTSGGVTCTRFVFSFDQNTGGSSRSATATFTVADGGGNTATATLSRTQNGAIIQQGTLSVANANANASDTTATAVITAVDMITSSLAVTTSPFLFVTDAQVQVVGGVLSLVLTFPANTGAARTETLTLEGTDNWGNTITATMTLTQAAAGATHSMAAAWRTGLGYDGILDYEGGTEQALVSYTGNFVGDPSVSYGTLPDGVTINMSNSTVLYATYSGGNIDEIIQIPITISRTGDDNVVYTAELVLTLTASGVFPIWEDVLGTIISDEDWEDYELQEGGETFYAGRAFAYPGESGIRVNLSRVVAPYLESYYKDITFWSGGVKLGSFTFVRDYSYDRGMDYTQDQWLNRPINGRVPSGVKLSVSKWGAAAGGSMQVTDSGGSLVVNEVLAKGLNSGEWISSGVGNIYAFGSQEYKVVDVCRGALLKYINAYGAMDYLLLEGVVKKSDRIARSTYEKDAKALSLEFESKDYQAEMTAEWTGTTGWLTDAQSARMKHMVESVEVYLVDLATGDEIPVLMTDSQLQHKTWHSNGKKLVNYTLQWKESQKKIRR